MSVQDFRYETWELEALVESIEQPHTFLVDTFFPGEVTTDAAVIEWDLIERGQRLAPFVSPFVQGKPMMNQGHATQFIKPAYIKPAKVVTPSQTIVRMAGERYGGQLTPMQRMDLLVAQQIRLHEDMRQNRLEWMAAKALVDGSLTITGDDYPSTSVSFARDVNLATTLSGTARWSQTTADPLQDIEDYALKVRRLSYGAVVDTIVMDGTAWAYFRTRMKDNEQFKIDVRGTNATIDRGPRNDLGKGQRVGNLAGRFDIWVYDGFYEDDEGATQPYLPLYTCLLIASGNLMGTKYYGPIMDFDANMKAQVMFHKSRTRWDPSGVELLSQSAPLLAPRRRNAYARITVHQ